MTEQDTPSTRRERLRRILEDIAADNEEVEPPGELELNTSLTDDLGLDSLDMAEMTVRLEDEYGVDVFADDVVDEVGEVLEKLDR